MSWVKNFAKPEGVIGKIMLNGMNHDHRSFYKWGFSHYEWKDDTTVLDIGCGGGMNINKILRRYPCSKACGIDISDQAVMKSTIMNRSLIGKRCLIRKGSADSIPFKDAVFDVVIAFETIYFWQEVAASFSEIYRVLKSGGTFLVCCRKTETDVIRQKQGSGKIIYTPGDLESFFAEAGFSDIAVDTAQSCWCCVTGKKL